MHRYDHTLIDRISKKSKLNRKAFIKFKESSKGIIRLANFLQFPSAFKEMLFDNKLGEEGSKEERSG
jgi:hypothetical protein